MTLAFRKPTSDHTAIQLLLRAAIGGTMIAHGVKHGRSIDGTARWFGTIGFKQPKLQAQASAVVEVGSGIAIVAGAGTPLACAAVVGTMTVAARSVHLPNGFFITSEGWEYVANLSVAAITLAAIGPGRFSLDRAFGLDSKFTASQQAGLAAGLGLSAAVAQLITFHRPAKCDD
ncbi:DoxX family protein [Williamsia sp. DF01-3]|uniref:DoxX family protein n=1 Tax=Williamsia sp. DF01-3 TaxID=2934157 RepID=UPI001FF1D7BC|nr:DoxX family protein [Williamsia sp. DF01-3]MCK0516784.1 DoxX family protein [Williamsia sp. DF01-3]